VGFHRYACELDREGLARCIWKAGIKSFGRRNSVAQTNLVVGGSWVARVVLKRCLAQEKRTQLHWKPDSRMTKAVRISKIKNSNLLEN